MPPVVDPATLLERTGSAYPEALRARTSRKGKRALGTQVGLTRFGVNLVRLEPGGWSSLRHWHTLEDEFVYVVEGEVTLVTDAGPTTLGAGMAAGFPAGVADGHHLQNRTDRPALYLEVGDRARDDAVDYPDVDLKIGPDGIFRHKDGTAY
jgi:uncharacterized cupin superfamily protein